MLSTPGSFFDVGNKNDDCDHVYKSQHNSATKIRRLIRKTQDSSQHAKMEFPTYINPCETQGKMVYALCCMVGNIKLLKINLINIGAK